MNPPSDQTKMVSGKAAGVPGHDSKDLNQTDKDRDDKTRVIDGQADHRTVRIRALYPIRLSRGPGEEVILAPHQEAFVTEEDAKEFCDRPFDIGHKDAFGNLDPSLGAMAKPKVVKRAERLSK